MGLTEQIDQARQLIKNSLECVSSIFPLSRIAWNSPQTKGPSVGSSFKNPNTCGDHTCFCCFFPCFQSLFFHFRLNALPLLTSESTWDHFFHPVWFQLKGTGKRTRWSIVLSCSPLTWTLTWMVTLCQVDGLVSASGSSEDMALVKKLNALEVENKQLKKGETFWQTPSILINHNLQSRTTWRP